MNFVSAGGVSELIVTVGAFFLFRVISHVFFISGERFVKFIGDNGIKVVTRLMGLILAVIGVQMRINGVGGAVIEFQKMGDGGWLRRGSRRIVSWIAAAPELRPSIRKRMSLASLIRSDKEPTDKISKAFPRPESEKNKPLRVEPYTKRYNLVGTAFAYIF